MNSLSLSYAPSARDCPALIPITPHSRVLLSRLVKMSQRADPFSRSPAYYLMTGRKGLWIYGGGDTAMIIAAHPNREGRSLLFPPIGREAAGLIKAAMCDPRLSSGALELARLGTDDDALVCSLRGIGTVEPHTETVLDWTYPIHVISPGKVAAREGKAFVSFRGHVHRAMREGLTASAVDIARDKPALIAAVNEWAVQKESSGFTRDDLTGPTLALIALMENGGINIQGAITRDASGASTGFWLWEEVDGTAMSLARVALRRPGNAELAIAHSCERLSDSGIREMCLGGSESAQLDAFKRKMQPIRSIALQTLTIRPEAVNQPDHVPAIRWSRLAS